MKLYSNLKLLLATILCINYSYGTIRGLNPYHKDHYELNKNFKCLDGSKIIPFDRVNDDFCDCPDGSDEPGTSACPNGVFYCKNEGYQAKILPSNRVLDTVCDCCDGSDEYNGEVECTNNCMELGKQLRADEEKKYVVFVEGNKIYKQYIEQGKIAKEEANAKIETLQNEKQKIESEKLEQDEVVKRLEEPETAAKDKFKQAWEEDRNRRREERQKNKALEIFHKLDINSDGRISLEELKQKPELDKDADGGVSDEEAKEYMAENEANVEFDAFYEKMFKNLEPFFKEKAPEPTPSSDEPPSEEDDEKFDEEEESDVEADDEEEEEPKDGREEDEEEHMPPYDAETQSFIDVADAAREVARDLENKLNSINNDIQEATKVLDTDYGTNHEFYALTNQCFELTDREYVYKLCPFDRSTQKSKHGGSETSLGHWARWENSDYRSMLFDRGQNCWNGPDRSTKVSLECGPENKLLSADEPSRCEYHFVLSTPAACDIAPPHYSTPHEEL